MKYDLDVFSLLNGFFFLLNSVETSIETFRSPTGRAGHCNGLRELS